ncbi:MAG TPA: hypothetical protein VF476_01070 [Chitinophagaceae bacterium]
MKAQTSILAYHEQEANGDNARMRELVLDAIKLIGIGTRESVAETLKLTPEQVGKRFSELSDQGFIYRTRLAMESKGTGKLQRVWAMKNISAFKVKLQS